MLNIKRGGGESNKRRRMHSLEFTEGSSNGTESPLLLESEAPGAYRLGRGGGQQDRPQYHTEHSGSCDLSVEGNSANTSQRAAILPRYGANINAPLPPGRLTTTPHDIMGSGGSHQLTLDPDLNSLVPADSTPNSSSGPLAVIEAHVVLEDSLEERLASEIEALQAQFRGQVEQEVNRTLGAMATAEVVIPHDHNGYGNNTPGDQNDTPPGNNHGNNHRPIKTQIVDIDGEEELPFPGLKKHCTNWLLWGTVLLLLLTGAIVGIVIATTSNSAYGPTESPTTNGPALTSTSAPTLPLTTVPPGTTPISSPIFRNQVGLNLDGEEENAMFGSSVAISAQAADGLIRVAVGGPHNLTGEFAGYAHIFDWSWSENEWVQVGSFDGETAGDAFGRSIALSTYKDRVVIGAPGNDGYGSDAGRVRIFGYSSDGMGTYEWVQDGSDLDGESEGDLYGWSVAISAYGDRVAIGAPGNGGSGDGAGYVRIFDWTGSNWTQVGLDLDGESAGDKFGWSVALSADGNRVAIGAPGTGDVAGHVRVFYWSDSWSWEPVGSDLDGELAGDLFGYSVALSSDGNRLVVGAPYNDGTGDGAGHVRIFDWSGSKWVKVGSDLDGETAGDRFGWSVAISSDGNRVAVGAPDNDGTGEYMGHVRIFDWSGSDWVQDGSDLDGEESEDGSGWSVAISSDGRYVAIGAPYHDCANCTVNNAGHVRIFDFYVPQVGLSLDGEANVTGGFGASVALSANGTRVAIGGPWRYVYEQAGYAQIFAWAGSRWVQVGSNLDGELFGDGFGSSVALSADGNRVAIGATQYNVTDGAGYVRIFDWSGSEWVQVGSDLDGEAAGDNFGRTVALSADGNRIAIGAPNHGSFLGQVRIFDRSGGDWVQVGSNLDGEADADGFGSSVALSSDGNRVAIGAIWNDGDGDWAGHVRIFDWSGSQWVQAGSNLVGEAVGDDFGTSVTLSSDGNRVAVGATDNDGDMDGTGNGAGYVRIFDWTGSEWVQVGSDLGGESEGDQFGWSVTISSDGNRVAVGAPDNDGTGEYMGHVRIFDWSGSDWIQVGPDLDGESNEDGCGWSVALSADGRYVAIGAPFNSAEDVGHVRIFDLSG